MSIVFAFLNLPSQKHGQSNLSIDIIVEFENAFNDKFSEIMLTSSSLLDAEEIQILENVVFTK